jgi:hypothetical protein
MILSITTSLFACTETMNPVARSEQMSRRPLTERSAQGRTQQPRRKMAGSQKQAYGKGGSASSKAVLSDNFFDENEIDQQMVKMNLGQSKPPLPPKDDAKPVPPTPSVPLVNESQETRNDPVSMLPMANYFEQLEKATS